MNNATTINSANQLNPYHNDFWHFRLMDKPPHYEIPTATKALWEKNSNPAGVFDKANNLNPYHFSFWNCRALQKPVLNDIPAGLNALINYYKNCEESGCALNPNNYKPLKTIVPRNVSESEEIVVQDCFCEVAEWDWSCCFFCCTNCENEDNEEL